MFSAIQKQKSQLGSSNTQLGVSVNQLLPTGRRSVITPDEIVNQSLEPRVEQLFIKLEEARKTVQKLNAQMGTTVVSSQSDSSSDSSGGDIPDISHTAEQMDSEFGNGYLFTSNVSYI